MDKKNDEKFKRKRPCFIQVSLTEEERAEIEQFAKEKKESMSTFCRRAIFEYIRKKEHPELFLQSSGELNSTILNQILLNTQKTLELEKLKEERNKIADNLEQNREAIRETYEKLLKKGVMANFEQEAELISNLLKTRKDITPEDISKMTNIDIDDALIILNSYSRFKLNIQTGRYELR